MNYQDHDHGHDHVHDHAHDHVHEHHHGSHAGHVHGATEGPMLWISLALTLLFVAGEAVAGYSAHSLALISDAGHNLSDALALGLAAYAVWIAKKPANAEKTYGYHRVGILAALFNAVSLIVIVVYILIEAYHLFRSPERVNGTLMLRVAAIALAMNTVIAYLLSGGAKKSTNMRAAFIHMAGDAMASLAVLIAGFIVLKTGWLYADPAVSILIAVIILYSSLGIVRDTTDVLLEGSPKGLDLASLVTAMRHVPDVCAVHDLHTWTVSDGMNYLSCHIVVEDGCTMPRCSKLIQDLNVRLRRDFNIAHSTIQVEVDGHCESTSEQDPLYCGEAAPTQAPSRCL